MANDIHDCVDRILWQVWDPIGVNDWNDSPKDEYKSYVPKIVQLLNSGADRFKCADHLGKLSQISMDLGADRRHDEQTADLLLACCKDKGQ